MLERTNVAPGQADRNSGPRPDGRRRQTTRRSLYLRSAVWGAVTLALIAFLGWVIVWTNEAGSMLP